MEIVNDETESYRSADMNAQRIVILTQPLKLNEDQQIVLEHLKKSSGKEGCLALAVGTLANIKHCTAVDDSKYFKKIRKAFWSLTRKQEAEVLQAFAEWGLSGERL